MFKLITSIVLYFFIIFTVNAEEIKKIVINGNERVSNETVMVYGKIDLNKKKDYSEKDLDEILQNLYSTNFFENVEINLQNGILSVNLIEYSLINNLIILGEESVKLEKEIKKYITSKEKSSYIKNNIINDINIIEKLYASIGFNFTEVNTKVRTIDNRNIDLIYEIKKGKKSKIRKINFTGDKKVREKRLRDIIVSEEDKFWKFITKNSNFSEKQIGLDIRLLNNYYKSNGYYDVKINSSSAEIKKTGEVDLTYSINAGERYIIKKILTNVDPVFDKKIFFPLEKKYRKLIGSYYSPFKTKKLLEDIDELIVKNNLQFVEHNVEQSKEEDTITIQFNIFEGDKVLVERINILGNNITNESVIRAELLLDEGDPFTNLNLEKSIAKIRSRNIFSSVKYKVSSGSSEDLKLIDIEVEEQATGELSAGAGVGTNGGNIGLSVKENNWLGKGHRLSFNVDASAESLSGSLNYTNPNYDFLGNALNYSISSKKNDKPDQGYENSIISLGIGTTFEQYKDLFTTLGLDASYDDLQTDSSASSNLIKQSGTYEELSANYGFTYDKRNRSFMPTSGSIVSFAQSLPIYADKAFIANRFSASSYKEFSENIIGAGKIYIATIDALNDEDVRLSKRKFLGSKRLRGFQRGKVGPVDGTDHIGGNYAAAINIEANLPKLLPESTRTDVGLFLDAGSVWGVDYDSTLGGSNKLRSSVGAAASWMSPIGPMTFILSQNISKASTDEDESFNFNLGTTF